MRRKRNYGYRGDFPYKLSLLLIRFLDRATKVGPYKFLRIIPDSGASQSHPTIRRKCFAIWITSGIHWDHCGSELVWIIVNLDDD